MWFNRLLKYASLEFYYHGTSWVNFNTIMSQGLNMNFDKVFTEEDDERLGKDKSIATYGGIYLTKNLGKAIGAAGNANQKLTNSYRGDRVIIITQIETKTPHLRIDEDEINSEYNAIQFIFNVNPNYYFYLSWEENNFIDIDKVAQNFLEQFCYNKKISIDVFKYDASIIPTIIEMIKRFVDIEITSNLKYTEKYDLDRILSNFPKYKLKTNQEAQSNYRTIRDLLTKKLRRVIYLIKSDSEWVNPEIRSMEPITFKGKNKIICILYIKDNQDYFELTGKPRGYSNTIEITYKIDNESIIQSAINDFLTKYIAAQSNHFTLKDRSGKIYYDNFNNEIREK